LGWLVEVAVDRRPDQESSGFVEVFFGPLPYSGGGESVAVYEERIGQRPDGTHGQVTSVIGGENVSNDTRSCSKQLGEGSEYQCVDTYEMNDVR